jgi:hypothetical protein
MYLFYNSRIHVISSYSGHVCVYYASMLRCWYLVWILVRTDHPCLGVGCHNLWCMCRMCSMTKPRYMCPMWCMCRLWSISCQWCTLYELMTWWSCKSSWPDEVDVNVCVVLCYVFYMSSWPNDVDVDVCESVSSPLMNFGVLNDNLIKRLISCIKWISRFLMEV